MNVLSCIYIYIHVYVYIYICIYIYVYIIMNIYFQLTNWFMNPITFPYEYHKNNFDQLCNIYKSNNTSMNCNMKSRCPHSHPKGRPENRAKHLEQRGTVCGRWGAVGAEARWARVLGFFGPSEWRFHGWFLWEKKSV